MNEKNGSTILYNPKIDFKFAINLWQYHDFLIYESHLKHVYNGEKKPTSLTDLMMFKSKNALIYLKSIEVLTIKDVDYLISIFEDIPCSYNLTELESLLKELNVKRFDVAFFADSFYKAISLVFTGNYRVELAKLLVNYLHLKEFGYPIIMGVSLTNVLIDLMKEYRINNDQIITTLQAMIDSTEKYNIKTRSTTIEEIDNIIKNNILTLVQNYGVKNIYLFGSYASEKNNEYSDIDLAVSLCGVEPDSKTKLAKYFESILPNKYDVVILSNKLDINNELFEGAIKVF